MFARFSGPTVDHTAINVRNAARWACGLTSVCEERWVGERSMGCVLPPPDLTCESKDAADSFTFSPSLEWFRRPFLPRPESS